MTASSRKENKEKISKQSNSGKVHMVENGVHMEEKPPEIPKGMLGSGGAENAAEAIRKHKQMLRDI